MSVGNKVSTVAAAVGKHARGHAVGLTLAEGAALA
jgi:hypothetical protein